MALSHKERQVRYRDSGRLAEMRRAERAAHPGRAYADVKRRRRLYPEVERARQAVYRALRNGTLERGPCEFAPGECRGRIEAHHDDYSRPLVVRWLCQRHHRIVHYGDAAA